jgi:hypothetical protein
MHICIRQTETDNMRVIDHDDALFDDVAFDVVEFEKELWGQCHQPGDMDMEARIKRQCGKCDRMTAIQMHLRLKFGANARLHAMSRHELANLVEMFASSDAINAIVKRLATFYARIAQLRARIEEIKSTMASLDCCPVDMSAIHPPIQCKNSNIEHLLAAYSKNEEKRREKQKENQRELARIMESSTHPDLTEDDLPALEMQVDRIVERGFAAEEMRRLKIVEAALEQQVLDELMGELDEFKREFHPH